MESQSCHGNQIKDLIFIKDIKSVKANMVNISIKSQSHRANGFSDDFQSYFFFILVSIATN